MRVEEIERAGLNRRMERVDSHCRICRFAHFRCAVGGQHLGVGIGGSILDLARLAQSEAMSGVSVDVREACTEPTLNRLMACGGAKTQKLRGALMRMLAEDAPHSTVERLKQLLQPKNAAQFCLPVEIGDYTDFYASIHHATNVGKLFRPDQPLMPNYKFVPIGYHGRASSIVISGTAVKRPMGRPNRRLRIRRHSVLRGGWTMKWNWARTSGLAIRWAARSMLIRRSSTCLA